MHRKPRYGAVSVIPSNRPIYQSATKRLAHGEHSEFFFHYTTADTAFRHILPTGELRLSPSSRMRDPLEAKAWHMGAAGVLGEGDPEWAHRQFWELQAWSHRAREPTTGG